ncbi:integral membrane sensor signal transduction histidine kinase [Alkaliphilus metalliredigens QYMF]|uniref:histidine kinase n=1 Tax=Alkaliphilus metalliredigens (strain QYMF) TaxID=293826 RepID=A6TKW1_ALKMQ|nr:ABC transporter substrate-binding protein [Alkaliphilus metalliredigens]ABR46829.1 integral membrane sensor signal transduction histidine kinase [Alkaliphilus metalliredigens QYMF]
MNKNKTYIVVIIIMILYIFPIDRVQGLDEAVLQLRWDHQFQFAGYYTALWNGYYEEEGLEVEIRSAFTEEGDVLQATQEVAEGDADFGVGAVDILIANDEGLDLAVLASIFQRSAVEFFMKEETPFSTMADLVNLQVARRKDDLMDIELQAMLMAEGIDPKQLKLYEHRGNFAIEDLGDDGFDMVPIYLRNILTYPEEEGVQLKSIRPIDYGIDFYGDSLFTRGSLAKENPDKVEAFKRASLKGWEYALENPEEIIEKMVVAFPPQEKTEKEFRAFNVFQAREVLELTLHPVVEIGNINPHRWWGTQEVLKKLNLVSGDLDRENFIFSYDRILQQQAERKEKFLQIFSLISVVILLIVLIIYLTAKSTIRKLEKMFQREWEENKRKEGIIIYQARLAAMGEMIANIAHQWRQPLNNLGLILNNIEDAYHYEELTKKSLEEDIERSRRLIHKMSETIDDFRNFSNPNTKKDEFSIHENIMMVLDLMEERIKLHHIEVVFKDISTKKAYGYSNQFAQGIFNVISNSIDALIDEKGGKRQIFIGIYEQGNDVITEIEDTGGGISEAIADKVFDLYFTTKEDTQGTGLGLYMTKVIIEKNLKGSLHWKNTDRGVKMMIRIPCKGVDGNVTD